VIIDIINKQKALKINSAEVEKIVEYAIAFENDHCDEVSINFVSTKKISSLHAQFFDDPTTTDCISFPIDDDDEIMSGYRMLGEIFVCPQTAIDYAENHQVDAYQELTLYIVHGLLHLMGYDDIDVKDRADMRAAEKRHMKNLQKLNLVMRPV